VLTKEHVVALVHSPITSKFLAKMEMQANLIAIATLSAKCLWVKYSHGSLRIKEKLALEWYALAALVEASLVLGWHTMQPKPLDKKSICSTMIVKALKAGTC
jgi:hypothetical protein